MGKTNYANIQKAANEAGSLRQAVYDFLRQEMLEGNLSHGDMLNQDKICKALGISRAPLRDALIRLETQGFVTVLPRKGIYITSLTHGFIKNAYAVIGSLEATCLMESWEQVDIEQLESICQDQYKALEGQDISRYFELNLDFHDAFLSASPNTLAKDMITPLKQRLIIYPQKQYLKEWEDLHMDEHERFIASLKAGNVRGAASILAEEHWSYARHKTYYGYYFPLRHRKKENG